MLPELARRRNTKPISANVKAKQEELDDRNVLCPVSGCGNWGGKGFRRDGISKHLMSQHYQDLKKNSRRYDSICRFLSSMDKRICIECSRITMRYTAEGLCDKCDKKRPVARGLVSDLTARKREKLREELISIQGTKFVLRRVIPRKLCTLWADILTDIALGMADATKESEALRAFKRYLMVKAVLIKPLRGGGGRWNRNTNMTEKLMTCFY